MSEVSFARVGLLYTHPLYVRTIDRHADFLSRSSFPFVSLTRAAVYRASFLFVIKENARNMPSHMCWSIVGIGLHVINYAGLVHNKINASHAICI